MTVRTFRNPEVPGPHARTINFGDAKIGPGETAQLDLPRLQMWSHRSSDGSGGDLLGEVDQQCPQLLEELNAPKGLVFALGGTAAVSVVAATPVTSVPDDVPEPAED